VRPHPPASLYFPWKCSLSFGSYTPPVGLRVPAAWSCVEPRKSSEIAPPLGLACGWPFAVCQSRRRSHYWKVGPASLLPGNRPLTPPISLPDYTSSSPKITPATIPECNRGHEEGQRRKTRSCSITNEPVTAGPHVCRRCVYRPMHFKGLRLDRPIDVASRTTLSRPTLLPDRPAAVGQIDQENGPEIAVVKASLVPTGPRPTNCPAKFPLRQNLKKIGLNGGNPCSAPRKAGGPPMAEWGGRSKTALRLSRLPEEPRPSPLDWPHASIDTFLLFFLRCHLLPQPKDGENKRGVSPPYLSRFPRFPSLIFFILLPFTFPELNLSIFYHRRCLRGRGSSPARQVGQYVPGPAAR